MSHLKLLLIKPTLASATVPSYSLNQSWKCLALEGESSRTRGKCPPRAYPNPRVFPARPTQTPLIMAKLAQVENTKTRFFCVSGAAENSRDFARPFNHSLLAVSSSALPRKPPFTVAPDELHSAAKAACAKMSPTHGSASKKPVLSVYFIVFWWDGPDLSNYVSSRFYRLLLSNIQFHIYTVEPSC